MHHAQLDEALRVADGERCRSLPDKIGGSGGLRERAHDWDIAKELCLNAQRNPENESERQQVNRLLPRLNRKLGVSDFNTMADTVATWHHDMQFQPPDGTEDSGRIQRLGRGRMHEHGLDGSYTEAWRLLADGGGRYLVIRTMRSGRLSQSLVVVGDQFVYARNREKDLPVAASLDTLISSTHPTRATIVEFLNFELSVGRVRGDSVSWKIEQSTLPRREGRHLEFVDTIATSARSGLVPRNAGDQQWTTPLNTFSLQELEALFGRQ